MKASVPAGRVAGVEVVDDRLAEDRSVGDPH
jgi:hypothetical protein